MSKAQQDKIDESSAPLIEHLAELRNRLIKSALAFVVGMVLCFTVATPIFNFLTAPLCTALAERGQDCDLIFNQPARRFLRGGQGLFPWGLHAGLPGHRDTALALRGTGLVSPPSRVRFCRS